MIKKDSKIFVAMSGGVDSSVAAALLQKQGFQVQGVFFDFQAPDGKQLFCCSKSAVKDAQKVADHLKIKLHIINMHTEFSSQIVDDFVDQYKNCLTPNPCVKCNREIKFGLALKKIKDLGGDYLATGHYVRLRLKNPKFKLTNSKQAPSPKIQMLKGKDETKDQSYFLHQLDQEQLKRVLFPVGKYTKVKVRKLARKFNLPVAQKKESQEVCFMPDNGLGTFLSKYFDLKKGEIKDIETKKVMGEHQGLQMYTIGQRKGIGLAGGPWFVAKLDQENNVLWVTKELKLITHHSLLITRVNWISGVEPSFPLKVKCKIRYGAKEASAVVYKEDSQLIVKFKKPQKAITPGQSAVFYKGKVCLGGGVILS